MLDGEETAGAAEARLNLVGDEHDPVLVADAPHSGDELGRRDDEAALSLNGLEDDRGDVLRCDAGREGALEGRQGVLDRHAPIGVRERHPVDLGREGAEPGLVRAHLRGEGEREQRPAVERALERDHSGALRIGAGELDRVLDRLGAGVEERGLDRPGDRDERRQPLRHGDVRLVRDDREVGVAEALELLVRGGDDVGVAVADVQAADAAGEVDEDVAVDVGQAHAPGRIGDDREGDRQRARDGAGNPFADLARARARNRGLEIDCAGHGHGSSLANASACENRRRGSLRPTIGRLLAEGRIEIDPYDPALLQPSSVDVRVDRYFRVFRNNLYPFIDVKQEQEELTELVEIDDEPFILHPGEFVLGSTLERVRLPDDLVARLEGKSSLGQARPADPLDRRLHRPRLGRARDARAVERRQPADHDLPGMKIGQLSFMELSEPAENPYGAGAIGSKYQGQKGPTPSRYWQNFEP